MERAFDEIKVKMNVETERAKRSRSEKENTNGKKVMLVHTRGADVSHAYE